MYPDNRIILMDLKRGDVRIHPFCGYYRIECYREICAFFQEKNLTFKNIGTRPTKEKAIELAETWVENFGGRFLGIFNPADGTYSGGKP